MAKRNRLTDMKVNEVSMVDRGANKRKFLITKNAGSEPGGNEPGGDTGGETKLKMTSDSKESLVAKSQSLLTQGIALAKMVRDAEVVDGAEIPGEVLKSIESIGTELQGLRVVAKVSIEETTKSDPAPEQKSEPSIADELAAAGFSAETAAELQGLVKSEDEGDRAKAVAQISALDSLLAKMDIKAPAPAPSPAPPAPAPAAPAAPDAELTKRLAERDAEVAKQNKEIELLKRQLQSPGEPRSRRAEGDVQKGDDVVSWPSDLNRDHSEDAIKF